MYHNALDHCYSPVQANSSSETPHKEEDIKRRKVDTDDCRRVSDELDKCSHPLEIESDVSVQHRKWASSSGSR